jgi:hypothetical protein
VRPSSAHRRSGPHARLSKATPGVTTGNLHSVRFGSLADMLAFLASVRLVPRTVHSTTSPFDSFRLYSEGVPVQWQRTSGPHYRSDEPCKLCDVLVASPTMRLAPSSAILAENLFLFRVLHVVHQIGWVQGSAMSVVRFWDSRRSSSPRPPATPNGHPPRTLQLLSAPRSHLTLFQRASARWLPPFL